MSSAREDNALDRKRSRKERPQEDAEVGIAPDITLGAEGLELRNIGGVAAINISLKAGTNPSAKRSTGSADDRPPAADAFALAAASASSGSSGQRRRSSSASKSANRIDKYRREDRDLQCPCPMYEINISRSRCNIIREEGGGKPARTTKSTDDRFAIRVVSSETVVQRGFNADENENCCAAGHQHATNPQRASSPQSTFVQSVAEAKPGFCSSTAIAQTYPVQAAEQRKYPDNSLVHETEKMSFQCICISDKVKSSNRRKSATKCKSEETQTFIQVELECYTCARRKTYLVCRACYRANKIRYCKECRSRGVNVIYARTVVSSTENILKLQNASQSELQAVGLTQQIQQESVNVQQLDRLPPQPQQYQTQQAQSGPTVVTLSCRSNTQINKGSTYDSGQMYQYGAIYEAAPPAPVYQPATVPGLQPVRAVHSPTVVYPGQPARLHQPGLACQTQTFCAYQDPLVSQQSSTLYRRSTEHQTKRCKEQKAWYGPPPAVTTNIILGIELKQPSSKGENAESDTSTTTSGNSSAAATPQSGSISSPGPNGNQGRNANIEVNANCGPNANLGPNANYVP